MSGAVKSVVNTVVDVVKAPLEAVGIIPTVPEPPAAPEPTPLTGLTQTEQANIAQEEAQRKAKKAKSGTQTVLTSPLGATTAPNTAVTKLGG